MSNYLCCAACLQAILGEMDEGVLVEGRWYHPAHAPPQGTAVPQGGTLLDVNPLAGVASPVQEPVSAYPWG